MCGGVVNVPSAFQAVQFWGPEHGGMFCVFGRVPDGADFGLGFPEGHEVGGFPHWNAVAACEGEVEFAIGRVLGEVRVWGRGGGDVEAVAGRRHIDEVWIESKEK